MTEDASGARNQKAKRLAAALRANLKRRKTQAGRSGSALSAQDEEDLPQTGRKDSKAPS